MGICGENSISSMPAGNRNEGFSRRVSDLSRLSDLHLDCRANSVKPASTSTTSSTGDSRRCAPKTPLRALRPHPVRRGHLFGPRERERGASTQWMMMSGHCPR